LSPSAPGSQSECCRQWLDRPPQRSPCRRSRPSDDGAGADQAVFSETVLTWFSD
jgi:hypothetical protein